MSGRERMARPLVFGSVCSGIEAASVAWHPLGWHAAFLSEIEAFPRAVLRHHYPGVPLHGDFTSIGAGDYEPIDLLVGGTPCQSFSIAGLRGGMADERGNLALEYLRLADRLRPRWLVWENVPGVLSSNGGRDFGSFLGGLGQLGYGFAYRALDAQYFALAQRRARVFVVGHLGDWRRAAAVLFEPASLRGHPAPRRETGQSVAASLAAGAASGSGYRNDADTADNLIVKSLNAHLGGRYDAESETLIAHALRVPSRGAAWRGDGADNLVAHSLRAEGFDASEDGTGRGTPLVPVNVHASQSGVRLNDTAGTLDANYGPRRQNGVMVPVGFGWQNSPSQGASASEHVFPTQDKSKTPAIAAQAVRRLTPRECERLMGMPDDYTLVPWRGGMAPDAPRYRAIGNSMAVPVMRWIGRRIAMVEAQPTAVALVESVA